MRGRSISDFFESCGRVVRKTHVPTSGSLLAFVGDQLLVNVVAWTAAGLGVLVVQRFFEAKGLRNLWGLAVWRDRTLVSADDYHVITTVTSYSVGLLMLLLVRHLVLRVIREFHALRRQRLRDERDTSPPVR